MKFNLVLPILLLESLDRQAKDRNMSRSLFIRTILEYYIVNLPFSLEPLGKFPNRRINIYLPPQLFIEIQAHVAAQEIKRSEFITRVLHLAVSRLEVINRLSQMIEKGTPHSHSRF